MSGLLQFGTYEIKTDVSFFPWKHYETETGLYVAESFSYTGLRDNTDPDSPFTNFFISTSSHNKSIERKYGKIDDVLSYFGGLFGIVMAFFAFFMMSFNEYRYELAIAEKSFVTKLEDGKKINEEHMTFLKYLKYSFYDWAKVLCCDH